MMFGGDETYANLDKRSSALKRVKFKVLFADLDQIKGRYQNVEKQLNIHQRRLDRVKQERATVKKSYMHSKRNEQANVILQGQQDKGENFEKRTSIREFLHPTFKSLYSQKEMSTTHKFLASIDKTESKTLSTMPDIFLTREDITRLPSIGPMTSWYSVHPRAHSSKASPKNCTHTKIFVLQTQKSSLRLRVEVKVVVN